MQKSNNRFNKPRSTDKKPSFKSDSKSSGPKRSFKSDKDSDKPFRKRTGDSDKKFDKPYKKREGDSGEKRSYGDKDKPRKSFDSDKKPFRKRSDDGDKKFDKPYKKREDDSSVKRSYGDKDKSYKSFDSDKKPFRKRTGDSDKKFDKPYKKRDGDNGEKRSYGDKDKSYKSFDSDKKPFFKRSGDGDKKFDKPYRKRDDDRGEKRSFREKDNDHKSFDPDKKHHSKKDHDGDNKKSYKKHHDDKPKKGVLQKSTHDDGLIRLNKYLSNAGVCSRREADELIKAGAVTVNGKVVTEMGYRIDPTDKVNYGGETLRHEKKVYLLLNKPKDYITTTDDPRERRTVMELIQGACKERVYPVGRLDRNTTGLLLFTNDGDMATKLMHPKLGVKKVYHVLLNHNMKPADYAQLHEGVELEDGFIKPDDASFTGDTKKEIGIEIHSGKNRIVRRIFEHLGYEVIKLDRVVYAGLTKKDLPRGRWRMLNEKEIAFLKMLG